MGGEREGWTHFSWCQSLQSEEVQDTLLTRHKLSDCKPQICNNGILAPPAEAANQDSRAACQGSSSAEVLGPGSRGEDCLCELSLATQASVL